MRTLGTHVATLLVGAALGLGAVAVANQPTAHTSAADTRIVRELHQVEKKLDIANQNLGGYTTQAFDMSIKQYLREIMQNTAVQP